jgi:hypothetical protein
MMIVRLDELDEEALRPRLTSSSDPCAKARNIAVLPLGSLSVSGMRVTLAVQGLTAGGEDAN